MDTDTSAVLQAARELLPWGTTVYTITRHGGAGAQHISALVVTPDMSIVDLSETLGALGFKRGPAFPGVRVEPHRDAHRTLVERISEAIHDDPHELMHEQL